MRHLKRILQFFLSIWITLSLTQAWWVYKLPNQWFPTATRLSLCTAMFLYPMERTVNSRLLIWVGLKNQIKQYAQKARQQWMVPSTANTFQTNSWYLLLPTQNQMTLDAISANSDPPMDIQVLIPMWHWVRRLKCYDWEWRINKNKFI